MSILQTEQAITLLRQGEVVAIPTETVYGLAARIDNEASLRRIFTTKQRPFFDPLIVHVESTLQAKSLVTHWPKIFDDLTTAFWPGPLTLIAPKASHVSPLITSGLDSVGLRLPAHPLALEILLKVGVPLAAPSANRFGRTSPTLAQHVEDEFNGTVGVVDGGPSTVGVESTVLQVDAKSDGSFTLNILRPGGVSSEDLHRALSSKYVIRFARLESSRSPGHLKAHYQPANPLVLIDSNSLRPGQTLSMLLEENFDPASVNLFNLELPSQAEQAARLLYQELRRLSQSPGVIIMSQTSENSGPKWEAIWDRLTRAASLDFRQKM